MKCIFILYFLEKRLVAASQRKEVGGYQENEWCRKSKKQQQKQQKNAQLLEQESREWTGWQRLWVYSVFLKGRNSLDKPPNPLEKGYLIYPKMYIASGFVLKYICEVTFLVDKKSYTVGLIFEQQSSGKGILKVVLWGVILQFSFFFKK